MVRLGRVLVLALGMLATIEGGVAVAQIPREQYLKYLSLTYPRLVRETVASGRFRLYGDPADPAFRDVAPRDGVDDARAAWLERLGMRFAPLMVRNSPLFPMDFRSFFSRPDFAIHVDTWDLARHDASLIGGSRIDLSRLAQAPCTATSGTAGDDCQLLQLVKDFGPGRGPVEPEVAGRAEQERFTVMYLDFPGYDAKSWHEELWPRKGEARRPEMAGSERVFVHPFIAAVESGPEAGQGFELVLQYWFFYPVNDGPNDHEGDWEHINVIVAPRSKVEHPLSAADLDVLLAAMQDPGGDDPVVIRRIESYFHHFVYPMDFSSPNAYQPRAAWDREVTARAKGANGNRWLWDQIRERAWQDAAETAISTRPVVWIGGDAIGVQSVLEMPGLKDQDGHASYPYRGYYKQIGPGVGERVIRGFDVRRFFEQPAVVPEYVEDYGRPGRVALLPDWERVVDPVLTDPAARRDWAWLVLPVRFGYPASPSPGAGVVSHVDTGNTSVTGPAFNGGWNRLGASSGYELYEAVKTSWATPLGPADSFFPRAGFLNAPILYFMIKPPLDLAWRTLALPVRAAVGSRQPTFRPAGAPPQRQVSLEAGPMITPVSEDFTALFYNRDQLLEIAARVAARAAAGRHGPHVCSQVPDGRGSGLLARVPPRAAFLDGELAHQLRGHGRDRHPGLGRAAAGRNPGPLRAVRLSRQFPVQPVHRENPAVREVRVGHHLVPAQTGERRRAGADGAGLAEVQAVGLVEELRLQRDDSRRRPRRQQYQGREALAGRQGQLYGHPPPARLRAGGGGRAFADARTAAGWHHVFRLAASGACAGDDCLLIAEVHPCDGASRRLCGVSRSGSRWRRSSTPGSRPPNPLLWRPARSSIPASISSPSTSRCSTAIDAPSVASPRPISPFSKTASARTSRPSAPLTCPTSSGRPRPGRETSSRTSPATTIWRGGASSPSCSTMRCR